MHMSVDKTGANQPIRMGVMRRLRMRGNEGVAAVAGYDLAILDQQSGVALDLNGILGRYLERIVMKYQ
jgi:hypothetical protein